MWGCHGPVVTCVRLVWRGKWVRIPTGEHGACATGQGTLLLTRASMSTCEGRGQYWAPTCTHGPTRYNLKHTQLLSGSTNYTFTSSIAITLKMSHSYVHKLMFKNSEVPNNSQTVISWPAKLDLLRHIITFWWLIGHGCESKLCKYVELFSITKHNTHSRLWWVIVTSSMAIYARSVLLLACGLCVFGHIHMHTFTCMFQIMVLPSLESGLDTNKLYITKQCKSYWEELTK